MALFPFPQWKLHLFQDFQRDSKRWLVIFDPCIWLFFCAHVSSPKVRAFRLNFSFFLFFKWQGHCVSWLVCLTLLLNEAKLHLQSWSDSCTGAARRRQRPAGEPAGISSFCHITHTSEVEDRVSNMELPPTLAPFFFPLLSFTCEKCGSLHLALKERSDKIECVKQV